MQRWSYLMCCSTVNRLPEINAEEVPPCVHFKSLLQCVPAFLLTFSLYWTERNLSCHWKSEIFWHHRTSLRSQDLGQSRIYRYHEISIDCSRRKSHLVSSTRWTYRAFIVPYGSNRKAERFGTEKRSSESNLCAFDQWWKWSRIWKTRSTRKIVYIIDFFSNFRRFLWCFIECWFCFQLKSLIIDLWSIIQVFFWNQHQRSIKFRIKRTVLTVTRFQGISTFFLSFSGMLTIRFLLLL